MSWLRALDSLASMRPTARIEPDRCTRRHDSGCSLCAVSCPKQAIDLLRWDAEIDADACIGCGLCVPACPVQAIEGVGPKPSVTAARVAADDAVLRCDAARLLSGQAVDDGAPARSLTDKSSAAIDVPCLAVLHPETLAAGAHTAGRVRVITGPCESCPIGAGDRVRDLIEQASEIARASRSSATIDKQVLTAAPKAPEPQQPEPAHIDHPPDADGRWWRRRPRRVRASRPQVQVSRRALLRFDRLTENADGAPKPAGGDRVTRIESTPGATPSPYLVLDKNATPREVLLASNTDPALPQLAAMPGCTGCAGCVSVCPTGALSYQDHLLRVDARDCVACGECVRICPEQVLTLDHPRTGQSASTLAAVNVQRCSRCDARLGPNEHDQCHRCATRSDLIDDVWRHLT